VANKLQSPLRRQNLREDALATLRAAILAGELEPGSIHSSNSLADGLGVSPTPVREAILELARQGLVESLPNRGFRIVAAEKKDLDEIRDLRLMLEVPALALVLESASPADFEALRPYNDEVRAAAVENDLKAFLIADRAFHLGLLELGGNARLVRIVGELRDQTRVVGFSSPASSTLLEGSANEHASLLDALIKGDLGMAQSTMSDHIRHTRGIWAGQQGPDPETLISDQVA
jgi:DNA-binding GntR family transcriptional regulator